jgi:predicted DNA-binding transcriptional regulator AlpA
LSISAQPVESPTDDRLLKVEEVLDILQIGRTWLYSPAGRAMVGPGLTLGRSRRYRRSVVLDALRRSGGVAQ